MIDRPKMHIADESLVVGSGEFLGLLFGKRNINCAIFSGVASEHLLDRFDTDLCSAIAAWECYRTGTMMNSLPNKWNL